ncbi:MAG: peptidylprolyl isomerase [Myxococcota bacterium]
MTWLWFGLGGLVACQSDDGMTTGETGEETTLPEGVFLVDMETTTGPVVLEIHEDWAPLGAARFRELVESGFYDGARFFRVVPDFVVQWGLPADPAVNAKWTEPILDDPVIESNVARTITFAATALPNSRTTQVFINYGDNSSLDDQGFAPFGRVAEGMRNVRSINAEYGQDPDQTRIRNEGNAYLDAEFPNLDGIVSATVR